MLKRKFPPENRSAGIGHNCDCTGCTSASVHHFERPDTSAFTDEQWQFAEELFDGFLRMQEEVDEPRFSISKLRYLANWMTANQLAMYAADSMRAMHNQQSLIQYMLERTDDTFCPVHYCQRELEAYQDEYVERLITCINKMSVEIAREHGRLQ